MFSGLNTNTTVKFAFWVICTSKHNKKFRFLPRVKYILFGFQTSTEYEYYLGLENHAKYEYYLVLKNHPNTNMNSNLFENICRVRIRISLFGLNYSNTIRIPNYSLTSDLVGKPPIMTSSALIVCLFVCCICCIV